MSLHVEKLMATLRFQFEIIVFISVFQLQCALDVASKMQLLIKSGNVKWTEIIKCYIDRDYGIKVFNSLTSQIKDLSANRNQFRCALENFLYSHSFHTLDEYFSFSKY